MSIIANRDGTRDVQVLKPPFRQFYFNLNFGISQQIKC